MALAAIYLLMLLDPDLTPSPPPPPLPPTPPPPPPTAEIRVREKNLLPLYTQIAHEFADLHDRAGRMKAKGCITDVLDWRSSRGYFYWRIRRRQLEDQLKERLVSDSAGTLSLKDAAAKVAALIPDQSDKGVVTFFEGNAKAIDELVRKSRLDTAKAAVGTVLKGLSPADLEAVVKSLGGK